MGCLSSAPTRSHTPHLSLKCRSSLQSLSSGPAFYSMIYACSVHFDLLGPFGDPWRFTSKSTSNSLSSKMYALNITLCMVYWQEASLRVFGRNEGMKTVGVSSSCYAGSYRVIWHMPLRPVVNDPSQIRDMLRCVSISWNAKVQYFHEHCSLQALLISLFTALTTPWGCCLWDCTVVEKADAARRWIVVKLRKKASTVLGLSNSALKDPLRTCTCIVQVWKS